MFLPEAKWYKARRLALLAIPFLLLAISTSAEEVIERIAAVVNEDVIFLSDVRRHFAFFDHENAARAGDLSTIKAALKELIDERLLAAEAKRFGTDPPPEAEVDKAYRKFRGRFPTEAEFDATLREYATTPEDFREEVRTRLWVDRFVDQRIRFFIFITQDDVERYYQDHAERFKGKKLESVREEIQKEITEERTRLRLKDYINRLRARANIRVNI
jgi:peptidyl-prolyl cis-trans isomerase SurA